MFRSPSAQAMVRALVENEDWYTWHDDRILKNQARPSFEPIICLITVRSDASTRLSFLFRSRTAFGSPASYGVSASCSSLIVHRPTFVQGRSAPLPHRSARECWLPAPQQRSLGGFPLVSADEPARPGSRLYLDPFGVFAGQPPRDRCKCVSSGRSHSCLRRLGQQR